MIYHIPAYGIGQNAIFHDSAGCEVLPGSDQDLIIVWKAYRPSRSGGVKVEVRGQTLP
ncbi:MAG: hypothetical protein HYY79_12180 [Betaproteobacteria bacterium]|nr:hypothetical protein [Betaproteobacteria bacterium]